MRQEGLNFVVEGGRALKGEVTTSRSKNGAVALLAATLLNRGTTTLEHVPKIEEVNRLIEILRSMGVKVERAGHRVVVTPPEKLDLSHIDREAATKTRSILLFIGSLLHHAHTFDIPQSGGCTLGTRTVRPHLFALEKFGVSIEALTDRYHVEHKGLSPAEIILYESSDTATENTLLVAAKIPGETVIKYASANYQVQDLCFFLEKLGVKVGGIGTSTLVVEGVKDINTAVSYDISEDPIETMFMIAAGLVTKSNITIRRAPIDFLEIELLKLKKMGFKYRVSKRYKSNNGRTNLVDIETFPSTLRALEEKIHPSVYPGLNIDNIPFFAVIATQAKGQTFIHDWVYEGRTIHYKELDKLGADVIIADPHRAYINGPTELRANEVICPPALRPAAIILIAMLAARGTSVLRNIYSINRGYEDLVKRLNSLGARIKILRE